MTAFLFHGVPVTHLDNNKILALNMQGANARLPPAPDQDTRSLACWSVLACWRPLGTLVEVFWDAQSSQTMLYLLSALLCSLVSVPLSALKMAPKRLEFRAQTGSKSGLKSILGPIAELLELSWQPGGLLERSWRALGGLLRPLWTS